MTMIRYFYPSGPLKFGIILLLICSMLDSLTGVHGIQRIAFNRITNNWLLIVSVCDIIGGIFSSLGYVIIMSKNNGTDKKVGGRLLLVHVNKIVTIPWTVWMMWSLSSAKQGDQRILPESMNYLVQIHFYKSLIFLIILGIITLCLVRIQHRINNIIQDDNYSQMNDVNVVIPAEIR